MCLPPLTPQLQNAAAARRAEAPNSVVAHTANPLVVSFNGYPLGTRFFYFEFQWLACLSGSRFDLASCLWQKFGKILALLALTFSVVHAQWSGIVPSRFAVTFEVYSCHSFLRVPHEATNVIRRNALLFQ
jgi:hypothetical protein